MPAIYGGDECSGAASSASSGPVPGTQGRRRRACPARFRRGYGGSDGRGEIGSKAWNPAHPAASGPGNTPVQPIDNPTYHQQDDDFRRAGV